MDSGFALFVDLEAAEAVLEGFDEDDSEAGGDVLVAALLNAKSQELTYEWFSLLPCR